MTTARAPGEENFFAKDGKGVETVWPRVDIHSAPGTQRWDFRGQ